MSAVARFVVVGALGFVVQLTALALLTSVAHWPWLPATVVAVELAIVHNFVWHSRWTWSDRSTASAIERFVRFNVSTALTSISGNVGMMIVLVELLDIPPVPANVLAVGAMSVANFLLADRWVFAAVVLLAAPASALAAPQTEALDAWNRYVARVEATPIAPGAATSVDTRTIDADGDSIDVPSGTISHWHGSVLVRGVTLERLLDRLQHPGTPPPQEDVVSSRVLSSSPDRLRVFIRMVRKAIVSVTYDTEHEMTFRRLSARAATARSVSTRIEEVGGTDHGFMWRLNSYWRYEETPGGVLVQLESLTLSRDVPSLLRPVARRLAARIARESIVRTLDAIRRYVEPS